MKKIILALAIVSAMALNSFAQDSKPVDENAPEITFKVTEINYGVIAQNADGVRKFEFTNTGKQPLVLANVIASCGCTVPEWSKEPVKPGEKGEISVKYNTAIAGTFQKTIRVFSNAKTSPVFLVIKGEVKATDGQTDAHHQ